MKQTFIYTLFTAILLSSCGSKETKPMEVTEDSTVQKKEVHAPLPAKIECFGEVDVQPDAILEIFSKADAFISGIRNMEGDAVRKGQVLATLESPDFARMQKDWLEAQAVFQFEEQQFKRSQKLKETNAISDKEFQLSEKEYHASKARYNGLLLELKAIGFSEQQIRSGKDLQLQLISPFNGFIVDVNAVNGRRVDQHKRLFTLIDTGKIHLVMQVPASNLEKLSENSNFYFVHTGDTIRGSLVRMNKMVSENNTVTMHGHLHESSDAKKLIVGQKLFIQFE